MKKLSLVAALILFFIGLSAIGPDALYKKMEKTYGSLSSFQATLKQENHFAQIGKSISYNGNIYFSKGRMVIRYEKPAFQRLMITGGIVELYDQSSKTVFRSRMRPEFGKMNPVEILQLYWKKSKVSLKEDKKNLCQATLTPFSDPLIKSLSAEINTKTGLINNLSYSDANGNKVKYSFSGIKTNAVIPSSVWQYSYPKNTQVVEQ